MIRRLRSLLEKFFRLIRLKPSSLAEKCRLLFGGAISLILFVALLIPFFWMTKLTEKIALDSGRSVVGSIYEKHFQINDSHGDRLAVLEDNGSERLNGKSKIQWIRFSDETEQQLAEISKQQRENIEMLKDSEHRIDIAWPEKLETGITENNYVRIVRANEQCITCHNPEGSASAFNKNEAVGAVVIQMPARELNKTLLMNIIWIFVAGLLAGTGAIIAFYIITQRIILRPIRQLRGLVSNVSEGNLDARSAIKTDDEFERLSDAFNTMLDGLQESQEKLRQANKQLDLKIVELSNRNIELFKANKLKSEFLANMSHEFRTPLNAILGFAEILKDKAGEIDEKYQRYAENILTSGRNLLAMINDLLDLAKAQAGKMKLHIEKTSIPELCRGIAAFFSPLTEQKKIKVQVTVDDKIPIILTDSGKVQQVLYNLMSNAIKFTPENGRIKISASMIDEKTVRISVIDTGCGIDEGHKENIFEKFRQIDGSLTRQESGTGLGLAICRELSTILAGNIGMESQPGKGSTFYLEIPLVLNDTKEELNEQAQENNNQ